VDTEGSSFAGDILALVCSISVTEGFSDLQQALNMQWRGPSGMMMVSGGSVTIGNPVTSGSTTNLTVWFSPLYTSHGGQYSCHGSLDLQDDTVYVSVIQDIFIQGSYFCIPTILSADSYILPKQLFHN